ncbi:ABC transporter ATP-binding protein [Cellulosimicrobium cellulans]|uniref:ABC transporter ATP-binding protein n=1 Tax=Cellulosimicrobium cellulans TaxID=1710 RepID=UPI0027DAF0B9|nr:ABC transporter ATP-binding protein [Cellulosimicrobium cellulans]
MTAAFGAARETSARETIRRVAGYYRPYRVAFIVSILIVLADATTAVLSPLVVRVMVDEGLLGEDRRALMLGCLAFVVIGALTAGLWIAQHRLTNRAGLAVVRRIRGEIFERLQRLPVTFFTGASGAEVQTRVTSDLGNVSDTIAFTAQRAVGAGSLVLGYGVAMFLLDWRLATGMVLGVLVLAWVNHRSAERQRRHADTVQAATSAMMHEAFESLSFGGVVLGRTLKVWGEQRRRFELVSAVVAEEETRQRNRLIRMRALMQFAFSLLIPLIYWYGGVGGSGFTVGTAISFVILATSLSYPVGEILGLGTEGRVALASFDRVWQILDLEPLVSLPEAHDHHAGGPVGVVARSVSFVHDGASAAALVDVDVDIAPGERVFVVGATGSGKSTLGQVLAGLLEPTSGRVEFRAGLRAVDVATLVPQEPVLLNASIRVNLAVSRSSVTEEEMCDVLAMLSLTHLVDRSSEGLDATVGEGGKQLSGGERQRLALARAFLAEAPVIVLDEVTSALDWRTTKQVSAALDALHGSRTLVLITHRLAGIRNDDVVLVMDEGRVAEQGTRADLVRRDGHFAALVRASTVSGERTENEHVDALA